ncbi:hypothetical protein GS982_12610 [Rhodococcus hoagii]|uniref:Uncharacterized protein n=1 Tax=Rhodococcus hoagii TaxID=43767 RepID=A0A9Q2PG27_RHOHA|nr:hypothetical protein [Prescottella equi]MBM4498211.1 hypothetical protein [Prescottella equi]MBM4498600.1 hypothetical protein [Prescottella equi]MBM4567624.1 hypothetical protein [Prescottella equi]MBP0095006.1 hypothetical protein [Prescottella equi]MCU7530691.1 hypothetical protein [Prescottella equi]
MSSTQDPQVQAAKLAYHRAAAVLHTAKANRIEADMKAAQDACDREMRKRVNKAFRSVASAATPFAARAT